MDKNFISVYTRRLKDYNELIVSDPEESYKHEENMNRYIMSCIPYLQETEKQQHIINSHNEEQNIFVPTSDKNKIREREIYNDYMESVEGKKTNRHDSFIIDNKWKPNCPNCESPDTYVKKDANICSKCGLTELFVGDNQTYDEEQNNNVVQYFPYCRENHFRECINQIQGQEITNVPETVMEQLRYEFKKQRVTDLTKITHKKVRELLKKLKLSKYYEHVPHITYHISGTIQKSMPMELEDKLIQMFKMIQRPFEQFCPPERKNFLSYPYVLYKFCELLGHDEYLSLFQLLKSKDKLREHDIIWKNICNELEWEFIETV